MAKQTIRPTAKAVICGQLVKSAWANSNCLKGVPPGLINMAPLPAMPKIDEAASLYRYAGDILWMLV